MLEDTKICITKNTIYEGRKDKDNFKKNANKFKRIFSYIPLYYYK